MIRRADEQDIPVILHMLRILHAESPTYRDVVPDEFYVTENIKGLLKREDICVFVAGGVGLLIAQFAAQWYEPTLIANEKLLYVLPGFRGSKASPALDLIIAMEEEGQRRGCRRAVMGATTGINNERTVRFYERMGYRRIGTIVEKQLETSNVR